MSKAEWPFISKVVVDGDIRSAIDAGVSADWFESQSYAEIWEWVLQYNRTFNQPPSEEAFRRQWGGKSFANVKRESMDALIDELRHYYRAEIYGDHIDRSLKLADEGNIKGAIEVVAELVRAATLHGASNRDVDFASTFEARIVEYEERMKAPGALRGAPTGFESLDYILGGLQPRQLTSFIGMPKAGKTMIMLLVAWACYLHGLRCLYYTFEMTAEELQERLDAFLIGVDAKSLRRGELSEPELQRLKKAKLRHAAMENMLIFTEDVSYGTSIDSIIAKIQQHEPRVLFVDGVYMMSEDLGMKFNTREEKLSYIVQRLRNISQQFNLIVIVSSQASEKADGGSRVTGGKVMYTQAFSQYSTSMIGVERNPDGKDITTLRVVHARNAAPGFECHIEWDWSRSSFNELHHSEMREDDDED